MVDHNKGRFNPSRYLKANATATRPIIILIMRDTEYVDAPSDDTATRTQIPAIIFIYDVAKAKPIRLDVTTIIFLKLNSNNSRLTIHVLITVIIPMPSNIALTINGNNPAPGLSNVPTVYVVDIKLNSNAITINRIPVTKFLFIDTLT